MSTDTGQTQIDTLRAEMNARLQALEKWLERTTVAVERLTENRDRILVLETRFDAAMEQIGREIGGLKTDHAAIKAAIEGASKVNHDQQIHIAKLDMVKAVGLFVVGALFTSGVAGLFRWLMP